ncbi:hypothetical protein [Azovibrio restrictus]|uniref:hypothetical protein n=1 Tax=Azovibrio restrictus TaxID=146938 RepID=UPI0026F06871|nr:hypothetical protein [Azovibrio restrictus]
MPSPHSSALDNALLILEILRRIPRRRYTTSAHLHEQVAAAGYSVSLRTVQRHLDAICSRFPITAEFSHRQAMRPAPVGITPFRRPGG